MVKYNKKAHPSPMDQVGIKQKKAQKLRSDIQILQNILLNKMKYSEFEKIVFTAPHMTEWLTMLKNHLVWLSAVSWPMYFSKLKQSTNVQSFILQAIQPEWKLKQLKSGAASERKSQVLKRHEFAALIHKKISMSLKASIENEQASLDSVESEISHELMVIFNRRTSPRGS